MSRNFITLLLALLALGFSGCKKGGVKPDAPTGKTFLIQTISTRFESGTLASVDSFIYDNKDRIIQLYSRVPFNNKTVTLLFTYDDTDRLTKMVFSDSWGDTDTNLYSYSGSQVHYADLRPDGSTMDGGTGDIQNNRLIQRNTSTNRIEYTYDSRGNITTYKSYFNNMPLQTIGPLAYDDKRNPFSMVKGLNLYLTYENYLPFFNTASNNTGGFISTKTYTYNSDGFPLTSRWSNGQTADAMEEFKYIVK
jgi:hypothetical protein